MVDTKKEVRPESHNKFGYKQVSGKRPDGSVWIGYALSIEVDGVLYECKNLAFPKGSNQGMTWVDVA